MQPPLLRLRHVLLRRMRRAILRGGGRQRGRRGRRRRRRRQEGGANVLVRGRACGRRRDHAHKLSVKFL